MRGGEDVFFLEFRLRPDDRQRRPGNFEPKRVALLAGLHRNLPDAVGRDLVPRMRETLSRRCAVSSRTRTNAPNVPALLGGAPDPPQVFIVPASSSS